MATIQIADNDARIQHSIGSGGNTANSTTFTIDFPFFAVNDINVTITNSSGVNTTIQRGTGANTFAVSGTAVDDGFSGGHVTLGSVYTSSTVTVSRDIPVERTSDFATSGPFNISSLNTELDKIYAIIQQIESTSSRALGLPIADTSSSIVLPGLTQRKGNTLAFNSDTGAAIVGPSINSISAVADNLTSAIAASASATASKESATASASSATASATAATNALNGANLPSSFSGQAGKIIKVNNAENAYEFTTSATNNGIFYGLKVNQTTGHLVLDYSVLGQSASFNLSNYDNYFFSSPQVTFALDSSGDLIITTP